MLLCSPVEKEGAALLWRKPFHPAPNDSLHIWQQHVLPSLCYSLKCHWHAQNSASSWYGLLYAEEDQAGSSLRAGSTEKLVGNRLQGDASVLPVAAGLHVLPCQRWSCALEPRMPRKAGVLPHWGHCFSHLSSLGCDWNLVSDISVCGHSLLSFCHSAGTGCFPWLFSRGTQSDSGCCCVAGYF